MNNFCAQSTQASSFRSAAVLPVIKVTHGVSFSSRHIVHTHTQGLKRSEQHALIELFKTRVVATSGGDQRQSLSERGLIQPIKKLEKLMRF